VIQFYDHVANDLYCEICGKKDRRTRKVVFHELMDSHEIWKYSFSSFEDIYFISDGKLCTSFVNGNFLDSGFELKIYNGLFWREKRGAYLFRFCWGGA